MVSTNTTKNCTNRNYVQKKTKILSNRIRCDLSEVEVKVLKTVNKAVHLRKLVITQKNVSPNINNPKKVVSPNVNNPKKVVSPNINNPKKIVSPNIKIETEKPVTKPQPIEQKVKKDKSATSAPTNSSMRKRTTHDDVMEDSDPEFNCKQLPMPGLESDNWFYWLGKEVQISFEKGKEKFIFVCWKCKRSCT